MATASTVSHQTITCTNPDAQPSRQDDTKKEKVVTFHLYDPDVSTSLLKGITLSPCQLNTEVDDIVEASDERPVSTMRPETEVYTVSTKMTCLLCSCNFTSRQQQRDHYKLDWHRFNLKQRMMGAPAVTEERFENISGDVSSISGSDSSADNDSDNDSDRSPYSNTRSQSPDLSNQSDKRKPPTGCVKGRKHPKVFFRNSEGQLLSIQRCILHGKKNAPATQQELVSMATQLPMKMKWLILMIGGGHFAGAIYDGKEILVHKTFHRYTVRAKRGTAQGMRDAQQGGNQPKSAGASLRRHNEATLVEDIQTLLASWADQTKSCHRIFLRAPSYNKNAFFAGKNPPLDRRDERIVTIPFATRRPTHKEIIRVHEVLSTIECYGDADEAEKRIMAAHSTKRGQQKNTAAKDDEKVMTEGQSRQKTARDGEDSKESRPEDVADSDEDLELVLVEEEISTLELQEFAMNVRKQPKRPKKKKKPKQKQDKNDEQGQPHNTVANLCEACRAGHWDSLVSTLEGLARESVMIPDTACQPTKEKTEPTDRTAMERNGTGETRVEDASQTRERIGNELRENPSMLVEETSKDGGSLESKASKNAAVQDLPAEKQGDKVDSSGEGNAFQNEPTCSTKSQDNSSGDKTQQNVLAGESHSHGVSMATNGAQFPSNKQSMMGNETEEQTVLGDQQGMMGNAADLASIVNQPTDELGNTLLHVAVQAEQGTILWNLMDIGADPAIKNKKGQLPYVLCSNKEIRKEFRRFMAAHPEKFDYERAQIPSPLTSKKEEMRAAKAAEKRRLQKKNKRIRDKEQKEEQKRQEEEQRKREEEEEEKRRFASLSDREKRALAAERRLQAQLAQQGAASAETATLSNTRRCWLCGTSLVGKVPFEYLDYKFCTVQCVKQHKQQRKTSAT